jgi:hypothetical protein
VCDGSDGVGPEAKIRQLSIAPLIAEAIWNIHDYGSVSSVISPDGATSQVNSSSEA